MIDTAVAILLRSASGNRPVTPSTEVILVYKDMPRIVYELATTDPDYTDDGDTLLYTARYSINIFAERMTEARVLEKTIRTALNNYKGTTDGTVIDRLWFLGPNFARGEEIPGGKTIARFSEDIMVQYRD
jgi:hypothetical protein